MRNPPLILIVEDNPASLDIMQVRLRANNYEVITAVDGAEGLALAEERLPDLILLDILMPKIDGLEVCRRIKENPDLPFMPIIMATAKADSKDVVEGLNAGADEYLTKPINHSALVARVKSMLRIKELHDQTLFQSNQLQAQLKTATKIQSLFWPNIPDLPEKSDIWAISVPAGYVGGDWYDVIPLQDDSILAYVGDVVGKGVPAALIMAALSTKIRTIAQSHDNVNRLLQFVNDSMYDLVSEEGYFATLVMIQYWPLSGKAQIVRAGHPNPVLSAGGRATELPQLNGVALGITPHVDYQIQEFVLAPGDSLLLYSDGIIEAENVDEDQFGKDRIIEHIQNSGRPPFGKSLLCAVDDWRGGVDANDDVTILEIWRDGL